MNSSSRMPVLFIGHGGGPMPLLGQQPEYAAHFQELPSHVKTTPKAIVVVSAHWEEDVPTVMTGDSPPLLFDYSGFPPETYKYKYPCKGATEAAMRTKSLLQDAGFKVKEDSSRGYDHGVFVPLLIAWPDANVPVTQVSLVKKLDPALHVRMGEALGALRDEGVLVLGSGLSFHNMRAFFGQGGPEGNVKSRAFDEWLTKACTEADAPERAKLLSDWRKAPHAEFCHPREEHLIPLMVCAGAAGGDKGKKIFQKGSGDGGGAGPMDSFAISAFMFGSP